ncbi:unnamed protein product [Paramecium sonneborni]|uniref:G domain-containing protein n=1 Tax=Paramecium sonneborni TaxID=65129 RepID=A0A8S1M0J1_9CILI|nr:unnamed protein product [Paramecium sonneborni]
MDKIEQMNEIGENIIADVIVRIKKNFTRFQQYMNKYRDKKVIILCGNTGAGKSSIYNWLLGADFKMKQENGVDYLQPHHYDEKMYISKMGTNTNSITETSIYQYIEELDHILVDLPGFESTKGDYHKLFIDLLFHKITTTFQTKIVYVLDNPQKELQNRGKDFTQFINQLIGFNSNNIPNIFLIINKYSEDGIDNEQIQRIQVQLEEIKEFKGRMLKNIHIIRKIKNKEMIQQIFAEQPRKFLLQSLIKSDIFTLQSTNRIQFSSSHIVNDYLMNQSTCYFQELKKMSQNIKQLIDMKQIFNIFAEKQEEPNSSSNIPQSIEGLYDLYTLIISNKRSEIASTDEFQNFKKIYDYFLPYEEQLLSYFCMNNNLSAQITLFNLIIDYLQQTPQQKSTENKLNIYHSQQTTQPKPSENQQNKWVEIFSNITEFIIRVAEKIIFIKFSEKNSKIPMTIDPSKIIYQPLQFQNLINPLPIPKK